MNIVAIDQEKHGLAIVINGHDVIDITDPHSLILPPGGGVIVADGNVWGLPNGLSVSQYAWSDKDDRTKFLDNAVAQGYICQSVNTMYAKSLYQKRGMEQADAVVALYDEARKVIDATGRFDSGKPVRDTRGDISYGQREVVVRDFLRLQNLSEYDTDFMRHGIQIAWDSLDRRGKQLFNLQMTNPITKSPNRLGAVLVCTHDPDTGERREFNGRPWGKRYIVRRILGLSGMMRGTGPNSPGNPMRAVLRILGRRHTDKINVEERNELDRYVKELISVFQKYEKI